MGSGTVIVTSTVPVVAGGDKTLGVEGKIEMLSIGW